MSEHPKIFTREYYQRLYEVEEQHWWSLGMRDIAARWLDHHLSGRREALRILDAGCGTGLTLSWLERYAMPDRIIGIDVAWYALEFCKARRLPRISQASIMELPFRPETFDLVTCVDVIQHLPLDGSEQTALKEVWRVLKPGGYLYVRTNAQGWSQDIKNNHCEDHYHRYTRVELAHNLTEAGFAVERVTHANSLGSFVAEVRKLLKPKPPSHGHGHHGGDKGLVIQVPQSKALNAILRRVMQAEAGYLAKPERALSFGHSLLCLAKKPR